MNTFLLRDSARHTNRTSPSGDPVDVNIAELGHKIKRRLLRSPYPSLKP